MGFWAGCYVPKMEWAHSNTRHCRSEYEELACVCVCVESLVNARWVFVVDVTRGAYIFWRLRSYQVVFSDVLKYEWYFLTTH